MMAYRKDEIVSASDMARTFSGVLNSITQKTKEKIAISRNNKLEAVIIDIDEYEALSEARELLEHHELYKIIKERENGATISQDDMLKKLKINKNELTI
ncbi:MAG: type II toxin-antitoxin system Phd/YefM family antitoxin [Epsilonproteobacteria bacterium]|nr:type II toxin-antitoxin system Phd/YefM family antitoxin [Campylobacterota bacterium]